MTPTTVERTKGRTNLLGYFPNRKALDKCMEEIQSIKDHYNRTSHLDEKTPFTDADEKWHSKYKRRKGNSNEFDFGKAISRVQILNEFTKGKKLTRPQFLGLATNMYWISGGYKITKELLKEHNDEESNYVIDRINVLKYVSKKSKHSKGGYFKPIPLKYYSPYHTDHSYQSIETSVNIPNGYLRKLSEIKLLSRKEAEKSFAEWGNEFLNDKSNSIYLIKGPTGLGKTRWLRGQQGVTIALPTHALKRELSEDMTVEHVCSPETPSFQNARFNAKIELLHKTGLSRKKFRYLHEIMENAKEKSDREKARRFLNRHNKTYSTSKTVLTTHPRGVFNEYDHNTLIFDEDPLQHIIDIKRVNLSALQTIMKFEVDKEITDLFFNRNAKCIGMDDDSFKSLERIDFNVNAIADEILKRKLPFKLDDFFRAEHFYKDGEIMYYSIHNRLPDKKIAIMSATVNEDIYRALYGDRVKVVDLSNTEIKGDIIQDTTKSYSKSSIENSSLEEINNKLDGNPTLTFKDFKGLIKGAHEEMHFGNVLGYDGLKGEDINVLGTHHKNNVLYLLTAQTIGIDCNQRDTTFENQLIRHNGFEFKFNCFKDKELRDLQLHFIESELKQAVGRARLLREDATVRLFSNLPLQQADFVYN